MSVVLHIPSFRKLSYDALFLNEIFTFPLGFYAVHCNIMFISVALCSELCFHSVVFSINARIPSYVHFNVSINLVNVGTDYNRSGNNTCIRA
jgi:hypothetical protein